MPSLRTSEKRPPIVEFGALCDPINKQLRTQGFILLPEDVKLIQKLADAACLLTIHAVITRTQVHAARKRIMKLIATALQKAGY